MNPDKRLTNHEQVQIYKNNHIPKIGSNNNNKKHLGKLRLKEAVKRPDNESTEEWIAYNAVDFFNSINVLLGCMIDKCSPSTCPKMAAGTKFEYLWQDNTNFPKPTMLCAREYMINLMEWVQANLNDAALFVKDGKSFPSDFKERVKKIFTRLFRVFAHIYYSHFQQITAEGFEIDWNSCFKHFYYFIVEFHLIDARELMPLERVINLFGEKIALPPVTAQTPQMVTKQGTRKEVDATENESPELHLQLAQESVDKYEKMLGTISEEDEKK